MDMKVVQLLKHQFQYEDIMIKLSNDPKITILAAVSRNGCLGVDNTIPWKLKKDMSRFKEYTLNKPILMGATTFESLPKLLSKRLCIVLSSYFPRVQYVIDKHKELGNIVPDVVHISSLEELYEIWPDLQTSFPDYNFDELVICGGSTVYEQFLPFADKALITMVMNDYDGDTYWPESLHNFKNNKRWKLISDEHHFDDHENECTFHFYDFRRPVSSQVVRIQDKTEISKFYRACSTE